MTRRRGARAAAAFVVLAATGCTTTAPGPAETTPGPATSPTSASSTPQAWDPGDIPDPSSALEVLPAQRGDCPVDPGAADVIAFVVTSEDDTAPVELTYPVFRSDGTQLVRRMRQPGPVLVVLQSDCTGGAASDLWHFLAASEGTGTLACSLFIAGRHVASATGVAEGGAGARADCSGAPGS
ncbi:hypothetical protein ABIQ69_08520 [Agromyces sp. G08B096]|uniref:Lipoprotein n=1 Tax=Agromyces sp. G08B096 TaxID=3156399 RepID=A0AAU7WBR7_9MICO